MVERDAAHGGAAPLLEALLDDLAARVVDELDRRGLIGGLRPDGDRRQVLTTAEAAEYLGVGRNRVREILAAGEIEGWQEADGGRWRVRRAALDRYLERREARTVEPGPAPVALRRRGG